MKRILIIFSSIFFFANAQAQITGAINVCINSTNNYSGPTATTYSWSISGGTINGSSSNALVTVTWLNAGSRLLSLTTTTSHGGGGQEGGGQQAYFDDKYIKMIKNLAISTLTVSVNNPLTPGSISGAQSICSGGNPPVTISNSASPAGGGGYSLQWQKSTSSAGSGFSNISGATGLTYNPPGGLTQNTWYRRRAYPNLANCGGYVYTNAHKVTIIAGSGITGSTNLSLCPGANPYTYTYSGCVAGEIYFWWVQNGTLSTSDGGSPTNVTWGQSGPYSLWIEDDGANIVAQIYPQITAGPGTPGVPVAEADVCSPRTLNKGGFTDGTIRWYWQNSTTDTSSPGSWDNLGYAATRVLTGQQSNVQYWFRAFNSSNCRWSGKGPVLTVSVTAIPSIPSGFTLSGISNCTAGTELSFNYNGNPMPSTWHWVRDGDSPLVSHGTVEILNIATAADDGTYRIAAKNGSCWSTPSGQSVVATYQPNPPNPVSTFSWGDQCTSTLIVSRLAYPPPSGIIRWYWVKDGVITTNYSSTYPLNDPGGTLQLIAQYISTGCYSSSTQSAGNISVTSIPSTPSEFTLSGTGNCTAGTELSFNYNGNPMPSTWHWVRDGDSPLVSHGTVEILNLATAADDGTYRIAAENEGCWSTPSAEYAIATFQPNPPNPVSTFSWGDQCTSTLIVSRLANPPPSGTIRWYWVKDGVITTNYSSTYPLNDPGGTLQLIAQDTLTLCYSSSTQSAGNISVTSIPAIPAAPPTLTSCGVAVIFEPTAPAEVTLYWQSSATGEETSETGTKTVTSGTVTYLRAQDNTNLCWSPARTVNYTIPTVSGGTISPANVVAPGSADGTLTLSGHAGNITQWETKTGTNNWQVVSNTSTTYDYDTSDPSTQVRAMLNDADCGNAYSAISTITVTIPITNSGTNFISYGDQRQLSTIPYHSYQWLKDSEPLIGETGSTLDINQVGSYRVKTRTSASAPEYTSDPILIEYYLFSAARPVDIFNVVLTTRISKPGMKQTSSMFDLTLDEVSQTINYSGGNGRTYQQIAIGLSPLGKDIVQPFTYDSYGRASKRYLPYASTVKDGAYLTNAVGDQANFYATAANIAQSNTPFAESIFSNDPSSRIIEQGAPGADWQPGNNTVTNTYGVNQAADNVWQWSAAGKGSDYAAGSLMLSQIADENGNDVITFTDKMGRTILKRVELDATTYLETYYVYDIRGRMIYQVPPKAVTEINANSAWATVKQNLVYEYIYDSRGRLIESKVPGAGWSYIGYDPLDRPVLSQDANMKADSNWLFTKWDQRGRKVLTGIYTNTTHTSRAAIQQNVLDVLDYSSIYYEKRETSFVSMEGYSNQLFPTTNTELLNVVYYDDYDFDNNGGADYTYDPQGLDNEGTATTRTRGKTTGTKTNILNSSTWLTSVVFYDDFGRAIQVQGNNHKRTTVDNAVTNVYDFNGRLQQTYTLHKTDNEEITLNDFFAYDHAGRLLSTSRSLNSGDTIQMTTYEYNELGQAITKKLHEIEDGRYAQTIDYTYNIRGWLKTINDADNITNEQLFGMELFYNDNLGGLSQATAYNGNISAMRWNNTDTTNVRAYAYTYDGVDRLTNANYGEGSGFGSNANRFGLSNITYDANGNIMTLQRQGLDANNALQTIDNLSYTYTGNQMTQVADTGENDIGFIDGANTTDEYLYDANGNMTKDENKYITAISYNILNKPDTVTFTDGRKLVYTYSGNGSKLSQALYQNTTLQQTLDYLGGMVYENDTLQMIQHGNGRIIATGKIDKPFEYQYTLSDHLGNTRATFAARTTVDTLKATMEIVNNWDVMEEQYFMNMDETRKLDGLYDHTDAGSIYNYSAMLTGEVGPSTMLSISAYDTVSIEVYAKYPGSSYKRPDAFVSSFIAALALGYSGVGTGDLTVLNNLFSTTEISAVLIAPGGGSNRLPNASLEYIFYDRDMVYQSAGFVAVSTSAADAFEQLSLTNIFNEDGYLYIYVNNTSMNKVVYFDDLTIRHAKYDMAEPIQLDDYYPFGLQTADSWVASETTPNNYLYNAASELNETTNNYQTFFRDYDPALVRMVGVDIMAHKYSSITPYNYAFNDPIAFNDPSGADPDCDWCSDPNATYNDQYFNATPIDGGMAGGHIVPGASGDWGNGIRGEAANLAIMFSRESGVDLWGMSDGERASVARRLGTTYSGFEWVDPATVVTGNFEDGTLTATADRSYLVSTSVGGGTEALAVIAMGAVLAPEPTSTAIGAGVLLGLYIYDAFTGGSLTGGDILEPGYGNPDKWTETQLNKTDPFMNPYNKPNLNPMFPPPNGSEIWPGAALAAALRIAYQKHKAEKQRVEFEKRFNTVPQDNTYYYNPKKPK